MNDEPAPPPREEPAQPVAKAADDEPRQEGPAERSDTTLTARIKARLERWIKLGFRLLPWGSLLVGIVSAFLQDRTPRAAMIVISCAVLGWAFVIGFGLLGRLDEGKLTGWRSTLLKAGKLSTLFAMQSLMQQCLFFALPYYVLAASPVPAHLFFLLVLVGVSAVTLWDPLYEKLVERHAVRFAMQFLATFVSVNAMLPALGMSNRTSLFVSGAVAALGIPLQGFILKEGSRREILASAGIALVGMPLFLILGGGAALPPAPIALTQGAMGTSYADHRVVDERDEIVGVPSQLVCGTDIRAPHGLKEELFHIWRHPDGHVTDELKLTIQGGRQEGFRTWTRKSQLGKDPWGTWTCSVVTSTGQLVGRRSIEIVKRSGG